MTTRKKNARPRPVGRPRTKPLEARERAVWLTDQEEAVIAAKAATHGMTSTTFKRLVLTGKIPL